MAEMENEKDDAMAVQDEVAGSEAEVKGSVRDLVKSAGAFLDDLDADVTSTPSVVQASIEASEEAPSIFKKKSSKGKGKKQKAPKKEADVALQNIEWSVEAKDLSFIEDEAPHETTVLASSADDTDMLTQFEALARRVAQTVAQKQDEDEIEAITQVEVAASSNEDAAEENLEAARSSDLEEIETELEAFALEAEPAVSEAGEGLEAEVITAVAALIEEEADSAQIAFTGFVEEESLEARGESQDADEMTDDSSEEDRDTELTAEVSEELIEFIEHDQMMSIIESLLFSTDKPVSIATIKQIFKNTNIRTKDITRALDLLASEYAAPNRGVTLEEIQGGYQLRTKSDNADYLRRLAKVRPFRLSGPALEVMAIVAYKQPITKHEIDEIRGVESGHLLRALMERGLLCFNGKSELPGKPMTYGSTRKFLETFGLRNIKELPTLSEIDELLPEGIGEVEEKESLSDITERMSQEITSTYSEGEDELSKINEQLQQIDTTSEFFEQEKQRERERRDRERAQDIRERLVLGDAVEEKDRRWLDRYEARLAAQEVAAQAGTPVVIPAEEIEAAPQIGDQLEALTAETSQAPTVGTNPLDEGLDGEEALDEAFFTSDDGHTDDLGELGDLEANSDWDEDSESEKGIKS